MEFISKQELLKAIEHKYDDLTDISGCYVRTSNGNEWLSVADIVELVNGCDAYEETNNDAELDHMSKELTKIKNQFEQTKKAYEKRIELLQDAIKQLMKEDATPGDVRVGKIDFLAIYQKALDEMFDNMEKPNFDELPNDIYGYDITVHWHGIYCNCGDGAVVCNNLIPAIEDVLSEDDGEY